MFQQFSDSHLQYHPDSCNYLHSPVNEVCLKIGWPKNERVSPLSTFPYQICHFMPCPYPKVGLSPGLRLHFRETSRHAFSGAGAPQFIFSGQLLLVVYWNMSQLHINLITIQAWFLYDRHIHILPTWFAELIRFAWGVSWKRLRCPMVSMAVVNSRQFLSTMESPRVSSNADGKWPIHLQFSSHWNIYVWNGNIHYIHVFIYHQYGCFNIPIKIAIKI